MKLSELKNMSPSRGAKAVPKTTAPAATPRAALVTGLGAAHASKMRTVFGGQSRGPGVGNSDELERVLKLPRRTPIDLKGPEALEMVEILYQQFGKQNLKCRCAEIAPRHPCVLRHLPLQAQMLCELVTAGGLIASAATGGGKSIPGIQAACALDLHEDQTAVLMIRPSEREQIIRQYCLLKEHMEVPGLIVHMPNMRTEKWRAERKPGGTGERWPTLQVLAYPLVFAKESSRLLQDIRPALIVADECDVFANPETTQTMRLLRYMMEYDSTVFACWTGSLMNKSIKEFWHLALLALRENSPLPLDLEVVETWAPAVDAGPTQAPAGALRKLCRVGEDVRAALGRRMAETEGFIITTSSDVMITDASGRETSRKVEIAVLERTAPTIPDRVQEALSYVRAGKRPDMMDGAPQNEIIDDPMEIARVAREVASGLFYKWIFPRREPTDVIDEWYEARGLWNAELREKIIVGDEWLDSRGLCEDAARRHWGDLAPDPNRPNWESEHWPRWAAVKDLVKPKTKAVRLDPFLVDDALDWAAESPGIVWYGLTDFAAWMEERSVERGDNLRVFGGGVESARELVKVDGSQSIIVSISSRGRGWDGLQYAFSRNLITYNASSGKRTQQLLARAHRRGQTADQVTNEFYMHTEEFRKAFDESIRCSKLVLDMFQEEHKLITGLKAVGRFSEPDEE